MFRIIILVTSSLTLVGAVNFIDCATDRSNTALTVHHIDFSPSVVTFPGDLHVSLYLTVTRPIPRLFVDVVLEKNTLGIWTKMPCIQNIGSCQSIDACSILTTMLTGSSIFSKDLGQQINAMLLSGLGHRAQCPFNPESLSITDYLIRLQPTTSAFAAVLSGKWRIQISVKEDPTVVDNVGCIRFEVHTRVPTPGVSSAASCLAFTNGISFTDCATDRSNTALTVHQIGFSPSPVTFPGDLHVSLNLTVNRVIPHLFVDVVLEIDTLGIWTKVPCFSNILFGSCQGIDVCSILTKIRNGYSILSKDLGQQIGAMLISGLRHRAQCPINPESMCINDYLIRLQPIPSILTNGKYRVQIAIKDDPTNPDNLGCIRFEWQIGVAAPGIG